MRVAGGAIPWRRARAFARGISSRHLGPARKGGIGGWARPWMILAPVATTRIEGHRHHWNLFLSFPRVPGELAAHAAREATPPRTRAWRPGPTVFRRTASRERHWRVLRTLIRERAWRALAPHVHVDPFVPREAVERPAGFAETTKDLPGGATSPRPDPRVPSWGKAPPVTWVWAAPTRESARSLDAERASPAPEPDVTVASARGPRAPSASALQPLEIDRIAERVMDNLDRRITAYRERLGRV